MPQTAPRPTRVVPALPLLLLPFATTQADTAPGIPPLDMPAPSSREVPSESTSSVVFRAHWDNDVISNRQGGIKQGTRLDSTAQAGVTVNGNRIGLPGATFHAALFAMRTGRASSELIGDSLGASNIEAQRNGLALATAYWAQQWRLWLATQIGVFDLNSVFDITNSASQLLNGSFGLDPTFTGNFSASTFPRNGSGAIVRFHQHHFRLKAGLLQAEVSQQARPFDGGALGIVEAGWQHGDNSLKAGLWRKRGHRQPGLHGVYFSGEQVLARSHHRPVIGFVRAGMARGHDHAPAPEVRDYVGLGVNWQAPLPHHPSDHLTFGYGQARLGGGSAHRHERVAEMAYIFRINRHLFLQPDLQYIDRPSGTYPAAWVATLRVHIE